ncbi:MAG: YebC/PmpR family DNA-binding transcriptional regulator [Kofleriaceae bacterium]|nr:YebC/PmpR family DNA-binding transcriptional regulator [Kofleriaceae bacterium]
MGRAFEKRKHTIFARMDRVAKQFTKINKDIAIAVKAGGTSPEGNPALRRALQNARAVNMPKDKVEAAIKKASGQGAANYDVVIYEGYAPHGIAVLVETATDNVTRTVANIRHYFKAHGGNMGTSGSVAFMFQKQAMFRLSPEGIDRDDLELSLIDHGLIALEDGESDKGEAQLILRCAFNDFGTLQSAIESRGLTPISSESAYVAQTQTEINDEEKVTEIMEMVAALEGDDDVQNVYTNLA